MFTYDKTAPVNDVIMLRWSKIVGHIEALGRGRYCASHEKRPALISPAPGRQTHRALHVDDVKDVAGQLKKLEGVGRAGTTVTIEFGERTRIMSGPDLVADLADADPDNETWGDTEHVGLWEEIETAMAREPLQSPAIAFTRDLIARLGKIRIGKVQQGTDVWDFALLGGNTVGVRFGPNFTGLLEGVQRKSTLTVLGYEDGGMYGDGPGLPGSLF